VGQGKTHWHWSLALSQSWLGVGLGELGVGHVLIEDCPGFADARCLRLLTLSL